MDANHFDGLLRSLSEMPTRRSLTRALASLGVAGGLTSLLGLADGEAKKKRKKKKKCKGDTRPASRSPLATAARASRPPT